MSYVIEDGIPVPPTRMTGAPRRSRSPLSEAMEKLEPEQSFLVDSHSEYKLSQQVMTRLRPRIFATRKGRDGWRIWRTE